MKKKLIRLTESDIHNVIMESVRRVLNEMGTPKQNAFLQRLMGNRYKPEYDDLSVSDSSKMIDRELQAQREKQTTSLASDKQIEFIEGNKYFPIPEIRKIEGKLTQLDAKTLVEALNPYTNGTYTYYGHARQKKEYWLANVKETVVPILNKYGLNEEAQKVSDYVDNFLTKHNEKLEREKQKKLKAEMDKLINSPDTLTVVPTNNDEIKSSSLPQEFYMDGILENEIGWDIAGIAPQSKLQSDYFDKLLQELIGNKRYQTSIPTYVIGYDKPCRTVVWVGINMRGQAAIGGRIVDESEYYKASHFAHERRLKPFDGVRI